MTPDLSVSWTVVKPETQPTEGAPVVTMTSGSHLSVRQIAQHLSEGKRVRLLDAILGVEVFCTLDPPTDVFPDETAVRVKERRAERARAMATLAVRSRWHRPDNSDDSGPWKD